MTEGTDLVRKVQELSRELAKAASLAELYRKAVKGILQTLEFDRAALYLYDQDTGEVRGTFGLTSGGHTEGVPGNHRFVGHDLNDLQEALKEPDRIKVWDNQTLKLWGKAAGPGWNAMVVLVEGVRIFGWLSVDNALRHRPLDDLERQVLALYGRTITNLIQRQHYEDLMMKYRAQNELKDRLFTILAHDLRGPIGNIGAMLGMAVDQPMDPEDLKEILTESRQAALRTFNLVENVLGWVRGQIEEVAILRERIPLRRPLISVQVWLESPAKAKGVKLVVDCHESLTLMADERMVETIVRNLVSNAVKYSPSGSSVILRGRSDHGTMVIEVIDQGIGMPPEKVRTLFGHQQQKSQPGTSGESGNGLGLMFSSDLAKNLGGHLEADSVPGKGSTFRLIVVDEVDGDL